MKKKIPFVIAYWWCMALFLLGLLPFALGNREGGVSETENRNLQRSLRISAAFPRIISRTVPPSLSGGKRSPSRKGADTGRSFSSIRQKPRHTRNVPKEYLSRRYALRFRRCPHLRTVLMRSASIPAAGDAGNASISGD